MIPDIGMTEEERQATEDKLSKPLGEHMGFGIWNVNQRMVTLYGEGAGLRYEAMDGGGTAAVLYWTDRGEDAENVSSVDRGRRAVSGG